MDCLTIEPETECAKGNVQMEKYLVAYAKVTTDKDEGICLQGVFFGGIGDTVDEADRIARDCINTTRGGTIIPKVLKIEEECQLIDLMLDAADKFERVVELMIEANNTIDRSSKKSK